MHLKAYSGLEEIEIIDMARFGVYNHKRFNLNIVLNDLKCELSKLCISLDIYLSNFCL